LLIETDVLLAAMNPVDRANASARKVLNHEGLVLSPFSLLEVNLLTRLEVSSIRILNDLPEYHSEAHRLESEFRLTFFDSLHAAVSKVQREIIASYDRAYDRLEKEGIKRLDPADI